MSLAQIDIYWGGPIALGPVTDVHDPSGYTPETVISKMIDTVQKYADAQHPKGAWLVFVKHNNFNPVALKETKEDALKFIAGNPFLGVIFWPFELTWRDTKYPYNTDGLPKTRFGDYNA